MEEEIVPLFPARTNYKSKYKRKEDGTHYKYYKPNGTSNGDVEKAELTFKGGVATSLRSENGVYRRLYQHTSNNSHKSSVEYSIPSEDENDGDFSGRRIRNSSCHWFLFCIIVIFFIFLLYLPAYHNVSFRPDASTVHDRAHSEFYPPAKHERYLPNNNGGTVVGWSFNKSRNIRVYVLPDNVTVLNQPKNICRTKQFQNQRYSMPGPLDEEPEIFVLVVITSALSHYDRRMAIRETWGNSTNYEFLLKRFNNISEHFANVNMTESLYSELGYSSSNISIDDKKVRARRDTSVDDDYLLNDTDTLPVLEEGNQIVNIQFPNDIVDKLNDNYSPDEDAINSVIKDKGANSYSGKQALLESLTDEIRKYNTLVDSAKQMIYSSYKQLDRIILNYYNKQNGSHVESAHAPCRKKRGTTVDSKKNDKGDMESEEKRAEYDEAIENEEDSLMGNFDPTDAGVDPEFVPEDYDYQTEQSNVMRIPRRGEEASNDGNVKKALKELKATLELSLKDDKLNLKYVPDKDDIKKSIKDEKQIVSKLDKSLDKLESQKYNAKKESLESEQRDQVPVNIKFLFLLGQSANENDTELQSKIDEEASLYGDIIQESFIDSYNNLTLKSVMLLKWVITNCDDNVHYVMKVDDDMFVNIPRLIEALKNKSDEYVSQSINVKVEGSKYSNEKLLMGDLICEARPISDSRSKWYSPTYMYSGKVYPKYLSGSGYVMSMGAARDLYQAALDTPLFHFEDVFLTGMCSLKAGIKPQDHPGFSYSERKFNLCIYAYIVIAHRVTSSQMRQMYDMLASNNTHSLEACEARRLINIAKASASSSSKLLFGKSFLGSPRNIINGLAGFGMADARKKKLKKANNGCM